MNHTGVEIIFNSITLKNDFLNSRIVKMRVRRTDAYNIIVEM